MNNKCLTVNFNYFDESVQHDSILSTVDGDIPEPRKALKISLNPLDKEQKGLLKKLMGDENRNSIER